VVNGKFAIGALPDSLQPAVGAQADLMALAI
jgi:hypothetical protein